ncbi:MAG: hypothetical protein ASARMPREDX12_005559 [Alectoria sarmentosa]|nr:MAG: hypothetical protein ASARMPREDX12_005559 [Alectoria sarmentosa]
MNPIIYFFYVLFAPWIVTYNPIHNLINARPESRELAQFAKRWVDSKLAELIFVGNVLMPVTFNYQSALLAATASAAFSWYNTSEFAWTVFALWYSSLVFSMTSICVATQQYVALARLNSYVDGPQKIANLLRRQGPDGEDGQITWRPRRGQRWAWQVAIMLMNFAVLLFLGGLGVVMWQGTDLSWQGLGKKTTKVAIFSSATALFAVGNYVFAMVFVYEGTLRDDPRFANPKKTE